MKVVFIGPEKVTIRSFTLTRYYYDKLVEMVEKGRYSSLSECIRDAIRFFVEFHESRDFAKEVESLKREIEVLKKQLEELRQIVHEDRIIIRGEEAEKILAQVAEE